MELIKSYTELVRFETFNERLAYLELRGGVGRATFGFDRYLNQRFYTSQEWKNVRREVLVRDLGFDLGVEGYPIPVGATVHHMNPMVVEDIVHNRDNILNPEYLITVSHRTHNRIHYGNLEEEPPSGPREAGDTVFWTTPRKE